MIRILLQYALPILLPFAVYFCWLHFARRKRTKNGEDHSDLPQSLREGPWFWLIVSGFALMVTGLAFTAVMSGGKPGSIYETPRYEDGKVIPGRLIEQKD